jgi:hypothetical protein
MFSDMVSAPTRQFVSFSFPRRPRATSTGDDDDYEEEYTVLKVQVGLFGDVRKWQKDLERLSELFDTEDEESLHYILQGGAGGKRPG